MLPHLPATHALSPVKPKPRRRLQLSRERGSMHGFVFRARAAIGSRPFPVRPAHRDRSSVLAHTQAGYGRVRGGGIPAGYAGRVWDRL